MRVGPTGAESEKLEADEETKTGDRQRQEGGTMEAKNEKEKRPSKSSGNNCFPALLRRVGGAVLHLAMAH